MHYCGMARDEIMFDLPYAHGLQLIHAALLSQGAHCVRPADAQRKIDCVMRERAAMLAAYQESEYDLTYGD